MSANGRVIWITGLSGAGKTTLARVLQARLPGSILLDGDELRAVFGAENSGFDAASRKELALSYARLAGLLASQGFTVLVATISMFREVYQHNRRSLPGYVEIFLDVPETTRRGRDPKGLYAAEARGDMPHMAGIATPVDMPYAPHLRLDGGMSVEESARLVLKTLIDVQIEM